MALVDLWKSDRNQISGKRIDQLIAFAGEGRLRDGNSTSRELRELLAAVPSALIGEWIDECLQNRFNEFGFVLQDIVNEIGRRLNFQVPHGVYRGHSREGFDGYWSTISGRGILVESKSTTAYQPVEILVFERRRLQKSTGNRKVVWALVNTSTGC